MATEMNWSTFLLLLLQSLALSTVMLQFFLGHTPHHLGPNGPFVIFLDNAETQDHNLKNAQIVQFERQAVLLVFCEQLEPKPKLKIPVMIPDRIIDEW